MFSFYVKVVGGIFGCRISKSMQTNFFSSNLKKINIGYYNWMLEKQL
jgi:hypothetical protein